jgi:hypothetical protein
MEDKKKKKKLDGKKNRTIKREVMKEVKKKMIRSERVKSRKDAGGDKLL